ncbi:MAG: phosphatase PAP2 family protein [Muribaculaceae bacterium]|nr:phosphatase PAP2 family protein [Muribaculaceae bacterium]
MQDITPLDLKVGEKKSKEFDVSFKPVQLIAPLSLIAVGTFGYYSKAFHKLNDKVRDGMTHIRGDHYLHFDDYLQYLPAAAYLGLGFYKGGRKLDWRERVAVEITAYLAMTAVTNIAKYSFKEKRPDSNARNSFPSGHTATTFTGAELIRKEFGWGIGGAAYAVATGVAFLRLYNGRHWLNDVIAGAGIGILSAQIGYWMLPHYRKWFHWDKKKNQQVCSIMPSYNDHTLSINMVMVF